MNWLSRYVDCDGNIHLLLCVLFDSISLRTTCFAVVAVVRWVLVGLVGFCGSEWACNWLELASPHNQNKFCRQKKAGIEIQISVHPATTPTSICRHPSLPWPCKPHTPWHLNISHFAYFSTPSICPHNGLLPIQSCGLQTCCNWQPQKHI